ncbi:MAG: tetratricopeptide repeat protein [Bacteroidia bacterium]|nr:tetratricopeptide repeat protein [Bacteroidia bacterium]
MKNIKSHNILIIVLGILIPFCGFSQSFEDSFLKASAAIEYQKYDIAVAALSSAIEFKKKDQNLYIQRGECLYKTGRYDEAIRDFIKADSLEPACSGIQLARCFTITGNNERAFYFLEASLKSKFKPQQRIIKLDKAFDKLQPTKEWKKLWKTEWYTSAENSMAEAEYYIGLKKYNKALEITDDILIKQKKNHLVHALRAKALMAVKDYENAATGFSDAIQTKPYQAEYYNGRAEAYFNMEKYKKSLEDYNKCIELNPLNLKYYRDRAIAESKLLQYDEAIADMEKYLKYYEDDKEAIYNCGMIYFEKKEYLGALPYFNRLLEKNKKEVKYFTARGNTYLASSACKYAEQDFTQALDLDPKISTVLFNRGIARFSQGNKKGACRDWEKARNLKIMEAEDYLMKNCR